MVVYIMVVYIRKKKENKSFQCKEEKSGEDIKDCTSVHTSVQNDLFVYCQTLMSPYGVLTHFP